MITRPTRLSDDSNTLIYNIFTNNLGKTHISGILTSPISDHLLNFCILEDTHVCHIKNNLFVEIEKISTSSINNFRNSVIKSEIMSKLDLDPHVNANENHEILSKIITESKNKHIQKKSLIKGNTKKEKWMTNNLLSLVNPKNLMYRDWKSTNNVNEYSKKKINFQTFENIVDQNIIDAKYFYYHNLFLEQRGDMKKHGQLLIKH